MGAVQGSPSVRETLIVDSERVVALRAALRRVDPWPRKAGVQT